MKVLLVNWRWYPTGGDWTYINNVQQLYKQNSYEIIALSTYDDKNTDADYKYFFKNEDFKELNNNKNFTNGIKAIKNSIISVNAIKMVMKIIAEHNDIRFAHFHNIHHYVTPAIISKLKRANIPIMWTLHDYKIICPENSFVSNGIVCEKCKDGKFYNCAINKCKKNSVAASSLAAIEAYYYYGKKIYDQIDAYLCPSEFLRNKFIEFGFNTNRLYLTNLCYDIDYIDNFQTSDASLPERYILYVGRLEKIKGVKTLIEAVTDTGIKLKIVGAGSIACDLKRFVAEQGIQNVEFMGLQNKDTVFTLTKNAEFVVCPSEWYENYPFSIIEAFLLSKPVIGSDIGGIPELVIDNNTGYLFKAGSVAELKEKLISLWGDKDKIAAFGKNARQLAYKRTNFNTHWNILNSIINKIKNHDE